MNRVLIIDPDRSFAKFAELAISRMGFSCLSARNARDGLQILRGKMVDLILTEIILPGMNGLELCRKLRSSRRTAHIPIIVATTDREMGETASDQDHLIDGCIFKPVPVRALFEVVQKHLDYENRRKNLRAPMTINVSLRDGTEYRSHLTLTVGEGGLFIETETPLKSGTPLDIMLDLPETADGVRIKGEVVYTVDRAQENHPAGMGVKFVNVDPGTKEFLANYMESYLSNTLPLQIARLRKSG